jgi:hypothetical protein
MTKSIISQLPFFLCVSLLLLLTLGNNTVLAEEPFLLGPPETEGPTVVSMGFVLTDINAIDEEAETIEFQAILILKWRDPRQAFDPHTAGVDEKVYQGDFQFNEVFNGWWPQIILINNSGSYDRQGVTLRIKPDGSMIYVEAINAVAETRLQMRRFPFDDHALELLFGVLEFRQSEVQIESDSQTTGFKDFGASVSQWKFQGLRAEVREDHPVYEDSTDNPFSHLAVIVAVDRSPGYILRVIALPLILLIVLTWSVFWMDRESLGTRMDISFIGILTVVAFQIVVSENLPRISYATLFDAFLYFCYGVLGASVVVNLFVGHMDRVGKSRTGDRIDLTARWVFPVVYFGGLILVWLYFNWAY